MSRQSLSAGTGLGWGTRPEGAGHQTHLAAAGCWGLGGVARTHVPQLSSPSRRSGRGLIRRPVFHTYQRDRQRGRKGDFAPLDPRAEVEPPPQGKSCPRSQGSASQTLPGPPHRGSLLHASSPAPRTPPARGTASPLGADIAGGGNQKLTTAHERQ